MTVFGQKTKKGFGSLTLKLGKKKFLKTSEKGDLDNQARILSKPEFSELQNCRITCMTLTNFF
jgi:hypothetical protein